MSRLFDPFRSLSKFRQIGEDRFRACCPSHDEKTPSFRGTLRSGKLLIYCDGCHASTATLLRTMGLTWAALFGDSKPPSRAEHALLEAAAESRRARDREETRLCKRLRGCYAIMAMDWAGDMDKVSEAILWGAVQQATEIERSLDMLA